MEDIRKKIRLMMEQECAFGIEDKMTYDSETASEFIDKLLRIYHVLPKKDCKVWEEVYAEVKKRGDGKFEILFGNSNDNCKKGKLIFIEENE